MKLTLTLILALLSVPMFAQNIRPRLFDGHSPNVTSKMIHLTQSISLCTIEEREVWGQDPLLKTKRKIVIKDYFPPLKRFTKNKTVILMPPTGGVNLLDNLYANDLCKSGLRVVLVSHWDYQDEATLDPIMHDRGAIRALSAVRNVIDYVAPAKGQLGIMGTSVGGITAALAMGVDHRISSAFFIVTGAGMVDIISSSSEKHLASFRQKRQLAYKLRDTDDYRNFLASSINIDPLEFADNIGNRPTSFIIAKNDTTVATAQQELLAKAFRSQNVVGLSGSHFKVILKASWSFKPKIRNFFHRTLN